LKENLELQVNPERLTLSRNGNVLWLATVAVLTPMAAYAQMPGRYMLDQYFLQGVPGYGTELGTTVLSRARPEYDPLGIRVGDFIIRPEVDESVGYNSDVIGQIPAQGSLIEETNASLKFSSDWARNSFGGAFSVTNEQVPSVPNQAQTSWSGGLGGTYQIGSDVLTLGATHLHGFIEPYGLDVATFNRAGATYFAPVPYDVNDVRLSYMFDFGRFSLTPAFDFSNVTFGSTTFFGLNGFVPPAPVNGFVLGVPQNWNYLDHNSYEGSLTFRYEYAPLRNFILVVRETNIQYISSNANIFGPNRTGNAIDVLAGLDYTASAVWRYRVLVGYEVRQYDNYPTHSSPVFEGDIIWQPTGLTTVTLKAVRTIEDAVDENVAGFNYTSGRLQVDHELRRNIILSGYGAIEHAYYLETSGGNETFFGAGAGVTYLMNRNVHLALTYDWVDHNGQNGFGPNYLQNIAMLQLRLAM
jgi:hypothetical protein